MRLFDALAGTSDALFSREWKGWVSPFRHVTAAPVLYDQGMFFPFSVSLRHRAGQSSLSFFVECNGTGIIPMAHVGLLTWRSRSSYSSSLTGSIREAGREHLCPQGTVHRRRTWPIVIVNVQRASLQLSASAIVMNEIDYDVHYASATRSFYV